MKREEVPYYMKLFVKKRDKNRCRYCGTDVGPFELDHVYPVSKGGETTIHNLVYACRRCNRKKHGRVGVWPIPVGSTNVDAFPFTLFSYVVFSGLSVYSYLSHSWIYLLLCFVGSMVSAHYMRIVEKGQENVLDV